MSTTDPSIEYGERLARLEEAVSGIQRTLGNIDSRLNDLDGRVHDLSKQMIVHTRWFVGTIIVVAGIVVAVLRLWPQ